VGLICPYRNLGAKKADGYVVFQRDDG
jgi:hypothetical protein